MTLRPVARHRRHYVMAGLAPLCILASIAPMPAMADEPMEALIGKAGERDSDGAVLIDLRFLNTAATPATTTLPDRVEALIVPKAGKPRYRSNVHPVRPRRSPSRPAASAGRATGFRQTRPPMERSFRSRGGAGNRLPSILPRRPRHHRKPRPRHNSRRTSL
ncbi:hypothetical protein [Novosphingobium sp. ST904]|uniref:hypothetical protein n=1 Tax=Novosphingobium sp. ST904 TaxID=1684385 RepID=UPI0006C83CB6|nr:hypothetical protein [Novosphingobium sp. ST904]KPH66289.1 hypothetical protein ADT71_06900 [Novosphingobium sp. ST904]